MMSVPFFGFFLSLLAVLAGRRTPAVWLLAISLLVTLALFKMHATDALAISM